jgi:hypothetical protein
LSNIGHTLRAHWQNLASLLPQLLNEVQNEKLEAATSLPSTTSRARDSYTSTPTQPTIIYSDNEKAIQNVKTEGIMARNKHFDIRLFKSKELQKLGYVYFTFIQGQDNMADGLTKALVDVKHVVFQNAL